MLYCNCKDELLYVWDGVMAINTEHDENVIDDVLAHSITNGVMGEGG